MRRMYWKSAWAILVRTVAVTGVVDTREEGMGLAIPRHHLVRRGFAVLVAMQFGAQCYAVSSLPSNSHDRLESSLEFRGERRWEISREGEGRGGFYAREW